MKRTILVILTMIAVFSVAAQTEDSATAKVKVIIHPPNYTGQLNVVYTKVDGSDGHICRHKR